MHFLCGLHFFLPKVSEFFLVMDLPREIRECSMLAQLTELEEKFSLSELKKNMSELC